MGCWHCCFNSNSSGSYGTVPTGRITNRSYVGFSLATQNPSESTHLSLPYQQGFLIVAKKLNQNSLPCMWECSWVSGLQRLVEVNLVDTATVTPCCICKWILEWHPFKQAPALRRPRDGPVSSKTYEKGKERKRERENWEWTEALLFHRALLHWQSTGSVSHTL